MDAIRFSQAWGNAEHKSGVVFYILTILSRLKNAINGEKPWVSFQRGRLYLNALPGFAGAHHFVGLETCQHVREPAVLAVHDIVAVSPATPQRRGGQTHPFTNAVVGQLPRKHGWWEGMLALPKGQRRGQNLSTVFQGVGVRVLRAADQSKTLGGTLRPTAYSSFV